MRCSHPQCTGNHDRNKWENICPKTREAGLARYRRWYATQTWREHHLKQLKTRRIRAVQRMKERGERGLP